VSGLTVRGRGIGVSVGRARLLDGVDLDVPAGSWTCVLGRNGAGKSTLLGALAGVRRCAGTVLVGGEDLAAMRPRARAQRIALAPQTAVVPPDMTVLEYALLGRAPHRGPLAGPRRSDQDVARQSLERLGLGALADRRVGTLSGGERQRAVLARALTQQPRVLLLDEPTAALDLGRAQEALELVDRLRREDGLTVVSTLHDLTLAGQYADELIVLDAGRRVAAGRPRDVLTHAGVAAHFGASAVVHVDDDGAVRVAPVRRVPASAGPRG
jgi:iron complex transport system ATP-binding protein